MNNNLTGIQHIGIPTNNMEATIDFYKKLGFEEVLKTETPDHNPVEFLQMKNMVMEIYKMTNCAGRTGAIDHVAIDVIDIDKAFADMKLEKMKMLDKQIQQLPFWEKGVRFFTIEGPNAEKIEFCQRL